MTIHQRKVVGLGVGLGVGVGLGTADPSASPSRGGALGALGVPSGAAGNDSQTTHAQQQQTSPSKRRQLPQRRGSGIFSRSSGRSLGDESGGGGGGGGGWARVSSFSAFALGFIVVFVMTIIAAAVKWNGSQSYMASQIIRLTDELSTLRSVETGLSMDLTEERKRAKVIEEKEQEESRLLHDRDAELKKLREELREARESREKLEKVEKDERDELEERRKEIARLKFEMNARSRKGKVRGETQDHRKERSKLVDNLSEEMAKVQEHSRQVVIEKWGAGQHKVELRLEFPPDAPPGPEPQFDHDPAHVDTILIQTASLDDTPHAVHIFLEQVAGGLWDGTSFHYHDLENVIMAGPVAPTRNEDDSNALMQKFRDAGWGELSAAEYHPLWPHNLQTVAFRSSPGRFPSFYVNLTTKRMGQMGLDKDSPAKKVEGRWYVDEGRAQEEPDPVFGRIVRGKETLERIKSLKASNGPELREYVLIKSARIVT